MHVSSPINHFLSYKKEHFFMGKLAISECRLTGSNSIFWSPMVELTSDACSQAPPVFALVTPAQKVSRTAFRWILPTGVRGSGSS